MTKAVGVYVDLSNLNMGGGYGMRFDVLRDFASRDGYDPVRLNVYAVFDEEKGRTDNNYRHGTNDFYSTLRDWGYKVIEKKVKWFTDELGNRHSKANTDLEMAVDALLQSEGMEKVILATGDGDFVQVARALQSKGLRCEVVAFKNVSYDLKKEADLFVSGYLIPGLLPIEVGGEWGKPGSKVRGTCNKFFKDKGYGFMRFLNRLDNLWVTDPRKPTSPYASAFAHLYNFRDQTVADELPSRDIVFEFDLTPGEKGMEARNIVPVNEGRKRGGGFAAADKRSPSDHEDYPAGDEELPEYSANADVP